MYTSMRYRIYTMPTICDKQILYIITILFNVFAKLKITNRTRIIYLFLFL